MTAAPVATETTYRTLLRTCGLLKNAMEPYFARFGITSAQWAVLRTLQRAGSSSKDGLRLTDLSERLLIQPPSVTGVVDRLERLGLVSREASSTDMRAKRVVLTSAGTQLVDKILRGHAERIHDVLGGLSEVEQADLNRLLERLGEHLEQVAGPETPISVS